jgi:predicted transcriptional regulator
MAQRSTKPVRGETDFELFEDTKYPSAEDTLSRIEVTEIISELCNHLSRSEAPVARMYYLNGYGNEEIANRLGITTAAVDSRLHKARKRLHFMFEGSGRDNKTDRLIHHLIQHMKERYVMDTIRVELSRELLELVKPSEENPKLLGLIRDLREDIRRSSGVTIPRVHVIDNLALPENTYEIYLQGAKAGNGLVEDAHEPSALLSALRDAMNRYKDSLDP